MGADPRADNSSPEDDALNEKLRMIDLRGYPEWYRPKLEDAIKKLGTRWPLHPANTIDLRRKAA